MYDKARGCPVIVILYKNTIWPTQIFCVSIVVYHNAKFAP